MKRLFAAIKIHPDKNFVHLYEQLRSALYQDRINWVDLNNVHLTLKFFGDTAENKIDEIFEAIAGALFEVKSLEVSLKNIGVFGSSYNPRVVWFGVENHQEIGNLYARLKNELEKIGYEYDRQNFVPHLTVGRIKYLNDKKYFQKVIDKYKTIDIQKEKTEKVILFESILRPTGAEYHVIEEFSLSDSFKITSPF
jgi:RNA 2',3'-cyclic 3'-phosphodiesterase